MAEVWEDMSREFRRRKRREFKEALKAMRALQTGCGLMPREAYFHISRAVDEMVKASKDREMLDWWKNS